MAKSKNKAGKDKLALVSFKLGKELFVQLKAYADLQTDEAGIKLSASQAARRLMLEALRRQQKNL